MESTTESSQGRQATFAEVKAQNPRLALVVQIEWTILLARYVLLVILWSLYATRFSEITPFEIGLFSIITLLQNSFVHAVLLTRRYRHFLSPFNFIIHLLKATVIVGFVGSPASSLAIIYLMLIPGFCLYSPNFRRTPVPTVACCAAYASTVLAHWLFTESLTSFLPVLVNFMAMVLAGLLVDKLGALLETVSLQAKNNAQALASSEATLRAILNNTASPLVVYDEGGFIVDANKPATIFLCIEREQLINTRFRSYLFDDGTFESKMAALRARGQYHGELVVIDNNYREHNVNAFVSSFMRDKKRLFVLMLHDITQQKKTQQRSRISTLRLQHVNRELARADELRTILFTTVAQRLRSPLTAILGHADLMLNEELGDVTEEQRKALQSCQRSVARVFNLVDEAMDIKGPPGEKRTDLPTENAPRDTSTT